MKRGLLFGKRKNCKSGILIDTVIFIVLNLVFIGGLLTFVFRSSNGVAVYEQAYAKQIALLIDSAKPVMEIKLNMEEAMKVAEKNKLNKEEIVKIDGNRVIVKLNTKGGYSYSFFNDVKVNVYPDAASEENYIITINEQ